MWSIGVIANLYPSSPVKIPCSAYSVSMDLAIAVDFWDSGPEAIGEDLHMYLKCFFSSRGHVIVKSIFSPASQCNIEGSGGIISGLKARYTQAKRHLWGSLDFGYVLRRTIYSFTTPESENTVNIKNKAANRNSGELQHIQAYKLVTMFYRLFEAHILPGQVLPILLVAFIVIPNKANFFPWINNYIWGLISEARPHPVLLLSMSLCQILQMLSFIGTITMVTYYEKYHQWVGVERWERFTHLGKRSSLQCKRTKLHLFDWVCGSVSGIVFGVLPLYHAQISHIFTNRLDYKVASKPVIDYFESKSESDLGFYSDYDDGNSSSIGSAGDHVTLPVLL